MQLILLEEAKKNSRVTQVSPKGWERVRELLKDSQGISALKREKIMFIDSEKRLKQLSDEAKKNTEDLEEAKKNSR
ncbi:hypothetical protein SK432_25885, partial [Escherichia coli]|nr:hypothetical protein [Escherichia coli]